MVTSLNNFKGISVRIFSQFFNGMQIFTLVQCNATMNIMRLLRVAEKSDNTGHTSQQLQTFLKFKIIAKIFFKQKKITRLPMQLTSHKYKGKLLNLWYLGEMKLSG